MQIPTPQFFLVCLTLAIAGCASPEGNATAQDGNKQADEKSTSKKLDDKKKKHTNALVNETSPYLLLHAHNPVNWYGWNEESLKKAKEEGKVIFLSIGYSSCHWCHVMERESFLDEEIAKILNDHFICIKVDREERPDVDAIYMNALSVISQGRGGWPLSMFLTPEGKPFFGMTYMPARDGDRGNSPGFLTLIKRVTEVWKADPATIRKDGETVSKIVKERLEASYANNSVAINAKWATDALTEMDASFDKDHGGFGFSPSNPNRPKFPEPSNLEFLVDAVRRNPQLVDAKEKLTISLDHMAMGGIRDHMGGGFHRYSVDRFWKIPHFEKMLYDNGQLASVYAQTYELIPRPEYKQVTVEMLDFVLDELTSPEGGFYSALDAESEDEEGKYYRWSKKEIEDLIGKEPEYALFKNVYQIDREPNFEGEFYAPQFAKPIAEIAKERKLTLAEMDSKLSPLRKKLFDVRSKRPRPLLDTKILASWNGLMIRGFAEAGRVFKEKKYVDAAAQAANFVLEKLQKDGRLMRTYSSGEAKLNAYLDDYAFVIDGLISLYKATDDKAWLEKAAKLQAKQDELFWDEKAGGYFFTSNDHESLLARAKNPIDGARPSGISVSANNLVQLAKYLKKPEYKTKCEKTILSIAILLQRSPSSSPLMLKAVQAFLDEK